MNRRIPPWTWLLWLALPLFLWWAWKDIPFAQAWQVVQRLQLWQLALLGFLDGTLVLLFSLRWWLILRVQGHPLPYLAVSAYRLAAFAISYLTPGTQFGGEPLQVALLYQRHHVTAPVSIASVTLDKLLELLVNFLFLLFAVIVVAASGIGASFSSLKLVLMLFALTALPLLHLVILWRGKRPMTSGFAWLARRIHHTRFDQLYRLVSLAENQMGKFCRQHPLLLGQLLLVSLIVWALSVLEFWMVFDFLGLALPFTGLMALVAAMRLAFLTPLPGGLGALEASQVWVLGLLGLPPVYGVGAVLWIRLRDFILAATGGWFAAHLSRSKVGTIHQIEAGG